jgi:4-hydroxybenzoate polyprenyltransferase
MIRKSEIAFTAVLLAIAILFLTQLTVTENDFQPVDSIDYARMVVIVFLFATAYRLIKIIKQYKFERAAATDSVPITEDKLRENRLSNTLVLITFFLFLFYCGLFTVIGYYTTGFIVLSTYMFVLHYAQNGIIQNRDAIKIMLVAVAVVAILYVAF